MTQMKTKRDLWYPQKLVDGVWVDAEPRRRALRALHHRGPVGTVVEVPVAPPTPMSDRIYTAGSTSDNLPTFSTEKWRWVRRSRRVQVKADE